MSAAPDKPFSTKFLLALQLINSIGAQLAMTVFFPFLKVHFSLAQMSLHQVASYAVPLFILPFIKTYRIRLFILCSFAVAVLRSFYVMGIHDLYQLYIFSFLFGLSLVFFWVPYELLYFRQRETASHGRRSSWYFGVLSIASVVAPITGGLIADHLGYNVLFGISAGFMLLAFVLALRLPNVKIEITLRESLAHLRGVNLLMIFDGFLLSATAGLLGLSLLTFTKTATQFGSVISLAGVAATAASMIVAHYSDRKNDRRWILYPLSIACACLLVVLGLQKNIVGFTIVLLILTSLRTVMQPIMNALPMDLRSDHGKLYVGRQVLLSTGRILGFALTWLFALRFSLFPMYVVYALAYLAYILIVRRALQTQTVPNRA